MGKLIYKDFLILRKSLFIGLLYIFFFMFVLKSNSIYVYTSTVIALTYLFVMSAFAYDDKNKTDIMINSLPVSRRTVVLAKYASIFAFMAVGTAAYIVIYNIVLILGPNAEVYPVTLEGFVAALILISLMNGIYLPLMFKLGYTRARIINVLVFLFALFGMSFLLKLAYTSENAYIRETIEFLNRQPKAVIITGAFVAAFFLLLISYAISLKLYKQREF